VILEIWWPNQEPRIPSSFEHFGQVNPGYLLTMEDQMNPSKASPAVSRGEQADNVATRPTTPLPPALPPRPDRRSLLLIYIHGFKGNETSFRHFPAV